MMPAPLLCACGKTGLACLRTIDARCKYVASGRRLGGKKATWGTVALPRIGKRS